MDKYTKEAVGLLERLISVPSVSRDEGAAAAKIAGFIEENGFSLLRVGNNVASVCPDFDDTLPTLLLDAHIDTVKPVSGWNRDPYAPVIEDGCLYGLGANDDGGSLVSLMQAYFMITREKRGFNVVFSASAEEEVSGKNGIERGMISSLHRISGSFCPIPQQRLERVTEHLQITIVGMQTI